jgi:hypothetical protein
LPDKKIDLDCSQSIQLANLVLSTFSVFYPFTFVFYLKPPALCLSPNSMYSIQTLK